MIEKLKVVTSHEMARIEKEAIARGFNEERFMQEAGRKVAEVASAFIKKENLPKKVLLLVGKGNNGGDAFAAGICLLEEGFHVRAFQLYSDGSPKNAIFADRFRKKGGQIASQLIFDEGLILDGLLGTGFKGKLEKTVAATIAAANASGLPILAIDIPSGLDGSTGLVTTSAIVARETVALGLPKMGFFLQDGWNHVGKLRVVDFGLPKEIVAGAEAVAYLPKQVQLPKIVRSRHKYQAGYVVGFGGSQALAGAAKLSALAALKSGAGIVRLFHPEPIGPAPFELICNAWHVKAWKEATAKAQSVFIGPGLGRSKKTRAWLKKHLKSIKQHCVLDADALLPHLDFPKSAILTPHRSEVLQLLGLKIAPVEENLFVQIARFCDRKNVLLILKGAPTFIFAPKTAPIIVPRGDPGMATAGAGDVLTGIVAGLMAQGCSAYEGAVLGVTLHAIAGEIAAREKTSYCLIASDLIHFMPNAFQVLMKGHDIV